MLCWKPDRKNGNAPRGNEALALHQLGVVYAHADPPDGAQAEAHYQQALALANELGMRAIGGANWPEGQLASTGEVGVLLEAVSRLVRENERLRKDNEFLRQEKALVWDAINVPRWRRVALELAAWGVVLVIYSGAIRFLVAQWVKA